jgi:hypothetical protein
VSKPPDRLLPEPAGRLEGGLPLQPAEEVPAAAAAEHEGEDEPGQRGDEAGDQDDGGDVVASQVPRRPPSALSIRS